jgi:alpha-L-rhamnosidase
MVGLDMEEGALAYKQIRIRPHISNKFKYASASYETSYGKLSSGWRVEGGQLILKAEIPVNTTATVYMPVTGDQEVTENGQVVSGQREKGYQIIKMGSGKYEFKTAWTDKE